MENPFIVEMPTQPVESEKKRLKRYLVQELEEDISIFSEKARGLIEKILAGEKLTRAENDVFIPERNTWWLDKYGFPFDQVQARDEILKRKYAPQKELTKAQDLQKSLLDAMQAHDQQRIKELEEVYLREYPDQLEGVTILFEMANFLNLSVQVASDKEEFKAKKDDFEYLTQYQFLLTDFIVYNGKDKAFMEKFWKVWAKIAQDQNLLNEFNKLKRGIMSQVAVHRLFAELGFAPKLSHPREDAFDAIDIWTERGEVVQIKGTRVPATQIEHKSTLKYLNSYMFQEAQRFRAKLKRYNQRTGKDAKGYFVVIPYSKFDPITGEPDEDFVRQVKKELAIG